MKPGRLGKKFDKLNYIKMKKFSMKKITVRKVKIQINWGEFAILITHNFYFPVIIKSSYKTIRKIPTTKKGCELLKENTEGS